MPHISIRVTDQEKADYRELAQFHGRSLTDLIKTYLARLMSRSLPHKK